MERLCTTSQQCMECAGGNGLRRGLRRAQVNELKSSIKFQLKKVLCMGVAIGNVGMEEKEIYVNTQARGLSLPLFCCLAACCLLLATATCHAKQHTRGLRQVITEW